MRPSSFTLLIDGLPPWIQAELLPRIVPVRWQLDALQLMHRELPEDAEALQDLAGDLASHALNRPPTAPEALADGLLKRAEAVTAKAAEFAHKTTIEQARKALSGEGDPSMALAALDSLTDAPEAEALQKELRATVLHQQAERIEGDANLLARLEDSELEARLAATIHSAVQDLRITAVALNIEDAELSARLSKLTGQAQDQIQAHQAVTAKANAARLRNYQLWALEQIRSVPALAKLESDRVSRIASAIDRNNPLSQARDDANTGAQDELAGLLIDLLSVVDLRLLDSAVGEWYSRVFSDRFGKLDEARQIRVVEGFANSIKRSAEDLP